jgi:glycosyltransferase involved in cell wall biosynthesis
VSGRPRALVFIVAYEAESTLSKVIARIPDEVYRRYDTEVLVIDDSSRDRTFEAGLRFADASGHPITVLYNPENQGYGGNQKLGYLYAIRNGFDYVVLLHGDGQYAPECIPALLAPLEEDRADAVFGSRMLERGAALRGGMPLYKYVGNRILSTLQNWMLRARLSEFHSGFRAYRVAALAQLPFSYNSNVFHFDTEIIIQLLLAGSRITEVPIPTYYGDEICRVEGMRYAKDVMLATLRSRLHQLCILYDRRFDVAAISNRHYALKLGYPSSHTMALEAVPAGARVLDVGCGAGDFAALLAAKGCRVSGMDRYPPQPGHAMEEFHLWDERKDPFQIDLRGYDCILLLDVIEHLSEPEAFLENLRQRSSALGRRPRVIVTTGNVVFWILRLQSLLGNFNYGKRGILDMTHSRLYTFRTLRTLFRQCGFEVQVMRGVPAPFPKALGEGRLSRALVHLNQALNRVAKGLFSYQIYMEATPLPTLEALLDDSITSSSARARQVRAEPQGEPVAQGIAARAASGEAR